MSSIRPKHRLEYALLASLGWMARALPEKAAASAGARLGGLVFDVFRFRRKVALDNLARAFPEKTPGKIKDIARRLYRNLGKNLLEFLRFPKLSGEDIKSKVKFIGQEHLAQAIKGGQGALLISSHFGNWELCSSSIAAYGYPLSVVVYEQHNPLADRMMNNIRRAKNLDVIFKPDAPRAILKALARNRFVAILIDQDAGQDGVFVDFMGRPASTAKGPAVFAIRTGAPLLAGVIVRQDDGGHICYIEPPIYADPANDKEQEILRLTDLVTQAMEKYVRKYPDHWYWVHRRWKTKPGKEENLS
ncbi:MAG: lysophospholipid acyltransferase family protein [Candidatus Edwardsbacteria bacterium]|nr:lysophospholipid acyltransferase family protein [Candidatus Edwardsbacteria bacterium]